MTAPAEIRRWFDDGLRYGAVAMFVVYDSFDHEDYPTYVWSWSPFPDPKDALARLFNTHDRVMEVYHLGSSREYQIAQGRAWNLEPIPGYPLEPEAAALRPDVVWTDEPDCSTLRTSAGAFVCAIKRSFGPDWWIYRENDTPEIALGYSSLESAKRTAMILRVGW